MDGKSEYFRNFPRKLIDSCETIFWYFSIFTQLNGKNGSNKIGGLFLEVKWQQEGNERLSDVSLIIKHNAMQEHVHSLDISWHFIKIILL